MIRKGQIRWLAKNDVRGQVAFIHGIFGIRLTLTLNALNSLSALAALYAHLQQNHPSGRSP